ncbi:hypothetical protein LA345_40760 (plasmid) [Burkholderia vietnamiensis]|uniref:Uncharacterized protein n=1 Tax=Burkholderia vietnamiensis (strain G4 / LMG 22486) TaxID=269482 RepID=A4JTW0_BURVG|nr:conserved hypothetical protein [Burkholderia vietnamiensis G4]MCB4350128.1 hypothetical protein [Burkholderia vietnamiensis]
MQVSINNDQRLFVIPSSGGYSCFGFDNCYRESLGLALAMGLDEKRPNEAEIGTLAQYEQYRDLLKLASQHPGFKAATWFDIETPLEVRDALERARTNGARLRIFYGDKETGRDWLSEYDVIGRIGRSMGTLKVPLMIANSSSSGGPAILDACIVRIIEAESKREWYRHVRYQTPEFELLPEGHPEIGDDYVAAVKVNGSLHARFKKPASAGRWIAFMKGERMNK